MVHLIIFVMIISILNQNCSSHEFQTDSFMENRTATTSTVYTYNFIIEWGKAAPDNFNQEGILINGQFPGPPIIIVDPNSTLVINVYNRLEQGFTLHMHGIHQSGTISSDGVPGVTQYEIGPDGFYKYVTFIGSQFGTFLYHAHTKYDTLWTFGALIIKDPAYVQLHLPYQYDYEKTLFLSQCFHVYARDIWKGLIGTPFKNVPDTVSLLINGKSWGQWPSNNNASVDGYEIIRVQPNKKYRLRLIGIGVNSMLSFSIQHHKMKVIEVDGILVTPFVVTQLQINTAQRFSVIVETNQPIANYDVTTKMVPGPGPRNGYAILHYEEAPSINILRRRARKGETRKLETEQWPISKIYPNPLIPQHTVYPIPKHVDREILITTHEIIQPDGRVLTSINGMYSSDPSVPLLMQLRAGGSDNFTNREPQIFQIIKDESVQIIFQHMYSSDNRCEQHPWHVHGHLFYVVGHGPDAYDMFKDQQLIESNIQSGKLAFRDVATLYAHQTPLDTNHTNNNASGTPCGWLVIRFLANNPGLWLVHCHLIAHRLLGKSFVLYEYSDKDKLLTGSM